MNISYKAHNFGRHWGLSLSGTQDLAVTWEELVWSAITFGKPSVAHLFTHGRYSLSDIVVRAHTVYANLRQTLYRIRKSNLYSSLDPTEKGATSYFIGMLVAKLIAERLLETPWLFHLSLFEASGGHLTLNGKSQPDLIGLNCNDDWVVIEAKGRTNGFSNDVLVKAKDQTRKLRKINGQFPALRVGTHAYFSPDLQVQIEDPEGANEGAVDIVAKKTFLFNNYYSFFNSFTRESNDYREILGRKMQFGQIDELGLSIGVDVNIGDAIESEDFGALFVKSTSAKELKPMSEDGIMVFPDGIAISLDSRWEFSNMLKQPKAR